MSRRAKVRARVPTRSFFAARDGMTNEEIASKLGISERTLFSNLRRSTRANCADSFPVNLNSRTKLGRHKGIAGINRQAARPPPSRFFRSTVQPCRSAN